MLSYSTTPDSFKDYLRIYETVRRDSDVTTPGTYLRSAMLTNLPLSMRLLYYQFILHKLPIYLPRTDIIARSTDLQFWFQNLLTQTKPINNTENLYVMSVAPSQITDWNIKSIHSLRIITVKGQINTVFDEKLPLLVSNNELTEVLGLSLALKLSPKHRVRVYKRNEHIIIFTTKGTEDTYENDYKFYRKVYACLPLLCDWDSEKYAPLIDTCKSLDNDDASEYYNKLYDLYSTNAFINNFKYEYLFNMYEQFATQRVNTYRRTVDTAQTNVNNCLQQYNTALDTLLKAQRNLFAIQHQAVEIDKAAIKLMYDKKICYDLDTSSLRNFILDFRCQAPLLSFDKEAALTLYNKRISQRSPKAVQKLFKLLFIDEKAVLIFDEEIKIDFNRATITAREGYINHGNDLSQVLPNPHHYYYNCWGSYEATIVQLIREYNLENLFYQIKAAVGSLNFYDGAVIDRFISHLNYLFEDYNPKCILWPTENNNELHTAEETLQHYLSEERNAN